ncbi:hypothetical protein BDV25DRAFT_154797 [Aspergillus avenaceus]|uniref:Myb-like domain-containing protein n=1 Tax=Aspergillus avenaceus TaxID=36643 RepID=A0A5N6TV90_ASPAV|nr:hypothetical protein BDV25DRAFT_154797 [Aspergillus avenaceus]
MSSSSVYEPEEDDETSDSDIDARNSTRAPPSSPPSNRARSISISRFNGEIQFRPRSRARKRTRSEALDEIQLSLSKESVDAYSNLLNRVTEAHASAYTEASGTTSHSTQNGIVIWTQKEKDILFNLLDRKGKDGVADIACAIGSKSELEVREHIRLLRRGLERQHLIDEHPRTIVLGDVPAAAEISSECDNMLDQYARLIGLKEKELEDIAGRHQHRNMWLVDRDAAESINEHFKSKADPPTGSSVYHIGALLNMSNWVRLSERIFMNFGGHKLEDNWVNVAYEDESPAMTADAFGDFYALTVSVTRRVIHSALFFAMSRIRNMRDTGNPKAKVVKARDVKTALDVLNMKRDAFDYWTGVPRRCALEVSNIRHLKGWRAAHLSHDEVEDMLSLSDKNRFDPISYSSTPRAISENRAHGEDPYLSDSQLSSPGVSDEESEDLGDLEEQHANNVDKRTSCLEELQIWKSLGLPAPASLIPIKEEDQENNPRKRMGERKSRQELADWRDLLLYRSEWEEHGHDIYDLHEEISKSPRKRRRLYNSVSPSPAPIFTNNLENAATANREAQKQHLPLSDNDYSEMSIEDQPATKFPPTQNPRSPPHLDQNTTLEPNDDTNNVSYRSPIHARRSQTAVETNPAEEENASSGSDNDLPAPNREYSSSENGNEGLPLYSQPMTPADWRSE